MKIAVILLFALTTLTGKAQDLSGHYSETKSLIQSGKNEEALERCIWYHENALAIDSSYRGVRLSFALSNWMKLAEQYPPALSAFKDIRDKNTESVLKNGGTYQEFIDLNAFNRELGEEYKTVELFTVLDEKYPKSATEYWPTAKRSMFNQKEYSIISKYLDNPVEEFEKRKKHYEYMLSSQPKLEEEKQSMKGPLQVYIDNNFVEDVLQVMDYTIAIEDVESTAKIQKMALLVIDDERIRMAY